MRFSISIIFLFAFLSSCKKESKYPYAIKDFSIKIQPYLTEMVTSGLVRGYGKAVNMCDSLISEKELLKLTRSEHPLLRAEALLMMRDRKGQDYTEIFMSHLDDTAMITIDDGEFGYGHRTVSDNMLDRVRWKSEKDRIKAVEKVVKDHNYLVKAYEVILELGPQEKYYNTIKQMAQRERPFYELEYAILSLARFKKNEDVQLINKILMKHTWEMKNFSFWLIKDFPNDVYWEVLDKYAKCCFMQYYDDDYSSSNQFMALLGAYKNDSSAAILEYLKDRFQKTDFNDKRYKESQKDLIYYTIWKNKCPAYSKFMADVEPYIIEKEKKIEVRQIIIRNTSADFNSHRNSVRGDESGGLFVRWRYHYYWD